MDFLNDCNAVFMLFNQKLQSNAHTLEISREFCNFTWKVSFKKFSEKRWADGGNGEHATIKVTH